MLTDTLVGPIQHVLSVIQLVELGRLVKFVTLSPKVAWVNQMQGSVPLLTPSRVATVKLAFVRLFHYIFCQNTVGGAVASWLVRKSPDQAVRV